MITWLPTYLRTVLHLSVASSSGYLAMHILGSLVGPVCYDWLSDRVASGQEFCPGGGRGFGCVPATVGLLATATPPGTAMGTCALVAYAVAFCAAMFLP